MPRLCTAGRADPAGHEPLNSRKRIAEVPLHRAILHTILILPRQSTLFRACPPDNVKEDSIKIESNLSHRVFAFSLKNAVGAGW
jgi:hypothetical protein